MKSWNLTDFGNIEEWICCDLMSSIRGYYSPKGRLSLKRDMHIDVSQWLKGAISKFYLDVEICYRYRGSQQIQDISSWEMNIFLQDLIHSQRKEGTKDCFFRGKTPTTIRSVH